MSSLNEIEFRGARADDIKFIFDSWLRSWRVSPWAGIVPNNLYYPMTRGTIEQLVARGASFTIACLAADQDKILGWCCHEQSGQDCVIHYIYVKDPYLSLGIAEELIRNAPGRKPGYYTFRYRQVSDACQPYRTKEREGWVHAPEIARRK